MSCSEGPDKGHAWVIAIAACVITLILSGISKMVGILYVAVIETFGVSRQEATLPFTFRKSLRCLAGPVVGVLGQHYGIRTVTLGGAVLASVGAALCFIAPTIGWLAFCWGGIHGLGEAFANTLFQVILNQYFEKYRSTASGIALSGACIGSIFFSFLIENVGELYGLQGTFLILSGVILHVIPAAILLKSPSWVRNETKRPPKSFRESIKERPRMYVVSDDYVKPKNYVKTPEGKIQTISSNRAQLEKKGDLSVTYNPFRSDSTKNLVENLEKKLNGQKGCDNLAFTTGKKNNSEKKTPEKRLSIQDMFTSNGNVFQIKNSSSCDVEKDSPRKNNANKDPMKKQQKKSAEDKKSMIESVKSIVRLYRNPMFVLVCVCMATYVFIFIPFMTSVVDYSKDKGLPKAIGKYLIHAMAIGDITGRLCLGWVTDNEYLSTSRYMTLTLVLEGIFLILIPFTYSFTGYLTLLALYSMTAGSMLVRLPVIVLKHVKKEEQSVAMGCYGFAAGLVPLATPGLIGYFRDRVGSYDGMYFLMGSLSIFSGGFWLLEPYLLRLNEQLENKSSQTLSV